MWAEEKKVSATTAEQLQRCAASSGEAIRFVAQAVPSKIETAAAFPLSRRFSSKLQLRDEVVDVIGGSSLSLEARTLAPWLPLPWKSACKVLLAYYLVLDRASKWAMLATSPCRHIIIIEHGTKANAIE